MIYSIFESYIKNCKTPKDLLEYMKKNIRYSNYTRLKSAKEVFESGSGSCHDQVMFELAELKGIGYSPKALFFMEYKEGQGGITHSFVYYVHNNKYYWFENAWNDYRGIHEFDSLKDIKENIKHMHENHKFGNIKQYPNLYISNFGYHKPGETLQEFVDKVID